MRVENSARYFRVKKRKTTGQSCSRMSGGSLNCTRYALAPVLDAVAAADSKADGYTGGA